MIKNKANREHIYFDSSINKEKEQFMILESAIGFNHSDFKNRILDELAFLGMEKQELAESCYLPHGRMILLLQGKANFEHYEINVISKRLGF